MKDQVPREIFSDWVVKGEGLWTKQFSALYNLTDSSATFSVL